MGQAFGLRALERVGEQDGAGAELVELRMVGGEVAIEGAVGGDGEEGGGRLTIDLEQVQAEKPAIGETVCRFTLEGEEGGIGLLPPA